MTRKLFGVAGAVLGLTAGTQQAGAIQLQEFLYDGDWRNGLGVTFEAGNHDGLDILFHADGSSVTGGTGGGDPGGNAVSFSVPSEPALSLYFQWYTVDGAEYNRDIHLPAGWSGVPTLVYDVETFAGSLTWVFTGSDPVPDGGGVWLGVLGLLGVAGARRWLV